MRLKRESFALRRILFYTFTQHSDQKSFIAKTFDGNQLKGESCRSYLGNKDKTQCFYLFLNRTYSLVLRTNFLRALLGTQLKEGPKGRDLRTKLIQSRFSTAYIKIYRHISFFRKNYWNYDAILWKMLTS